MNRLQTILIISVLCVSCATRKMDGLYSDDLSGCVTCIHHDSIAIGYKRVLSERLLFYYLGSYKLEQDKIVLSNNTLKYNNMIIEEVFTDYPGIEIQLFELVPDVVMGAPTRVDTTYYVLAKQCEIYFDFKPPYIEIFTGKHKPSFETKNGLIQIPLEVLHEDGEDAFEFFIMGCTNFFSEARIIAKPHTRYLIKQKSLYYRPLVPQEIPVIYNKKTNQIEITESNAKNNLPFRTIKLKHINKSGSCMDELRKSYPDL